MNSKEKQMDKVSVKTLPTLKFDFMNLKNFLYICSIFVLGVVCYLGYLVKESLEYRHIDLGSISTEVDSSKFVSAMVGPSFQESWTYAPKLKVMESGNSSKPTVASKLKPKAESEAKPKSNPKSKSNSNSNSNSDSGPIL